VLADAERILGADHSDTVTTRSTLEQMEVELQEPDSG
jgi:hypothetical protein